MLFLKISQYSQENACIKKRLQHSCFLVNIAKFLRNPISKDVCERLLLTFPGKRLLQILGNSKILSKLKKFLKKSKWKPQSINKIQFPPPITN